MAEPSSPPYVGQLAFSPVQYWVSGDFDPAALIEVLKAQPGLGDFTDEQGIQSAVRLDNDPGGAAGYWVSVPDSIAESVVKAGVAAYVAPAAPTPPPPPPASAADTVLAALSALDPDTASIADVVNAVKDALTAAGATPA